MARWAASSPASRLRCNTNALVLSRRPIAPFEIDRGANLRSISVQDRSYALSRTGDGWVNAVYVLFVIVMLALLAAGAWRDIATRTIPDEVNASLFVVGGVARLVQGPQELFFSGLAALVLFLLFMFAFSRGWIGGGDVKLLTAFAIGLSPSDCYRFVVVTALAGGVLGVTYLLLSHRLVPKRISSRTSLLKRVMAAEAWRIRRRGPLPYGVAIAAGGAFVLLHPGSF